MIFGKIFHNRNKIKTEHSAVLEKEIKLAKSDLDSARVIVSFCEQHDYAPRAVIALLSRMGLYNSGLMPLVKSVINSRGYSVEFKHKIRDQYLSKNPTYDTSNEITRKIASVNKIPLSDVVDILREETVMISRLGDVAKSYMLRNKFFTKERVEEILTKLNIDFAEIPEDKKLHLARAVVHGKLISSLEGSKSIPSEAFLLECKKGFIGIEQDMFNKNIKHANPYPIRLWKEGDDICYTYPFDLDNINCITNLFHENKDYSGSFYLDNGEIKNSFLDAFNGVTPIFKINSRDLLFYSHEGDFYIKTDVSGSGGGSDYVKAIVGGVLFGAAGAIVASRKGVNISTTTEEVDKRNTVLYYKYKGEIMDAHFDSNTYKTFKRLLPGKDSSVIDKLSGSPPTSTDNTSTEEVAAATNDGITERMKKLSSLLENGYITKDEYEEKKKKIIDEI